jgi:hypothetical protein
MKNTIKTFACIALIAGILTQCSKGTQTSGGGTGTGSLSLSSSSVFKGQPLQASATDPSNATLVKWTVTPATANQIFSANNNSTILFAAPGTYTVTASYYADSSSGAPIDSISSPVTVIDSIYTPPVNTNADTLSLAGDQLQITPQALSDSGFVFEVRTANLYNCIPYFIGYSWGMSRDTLTAGFDYISNTLVNNCGGSKSPAGVYLFYGAVTDGNYQIEIEFNHQYYHGSVNVSGSTYTFTWPYSSGVTISPLQIQKQ